MGEGRDLSRREVEQLRSGAIGNVRDLGQHRVASIVRAVAAGARSEGDFVQRLRGEGLIVKARCAKQDRGTVSGYSEAAKTGGPEPLVWYGGGRLGKDRRLPALRTKWGQTDQQRKSSAAARFSDAESRRKAGPANLAAAADAMRQAAERLQKVPPENRFSWYVAAAESTGVVAAPVTGQRVASDAAGELSALLGGTPRVLMAARLAGAPQHAAVQALLVQSVELAAQIARTLAAQQKGSAAQQRAAAATERALSMLTSPARQAGWQFTRTGEEALEATRQALSSTSTRPGRQRPGGASRNHRTNDERRFRPEVQQLLNYRSPRAARIKSVNQVDRLRNADTRPGLSAVKHDDRVAAVQIAREAEPLLPLRQHC